MEVPDGDHIRNQGVGIEWLMAIGNLHLVDVKSQDEILWKRRDNLAKILIVANVDEVHLEMLINCWMVEHMWSRLATIHEQTSRKNLQILLQGEFFSYKM